MDKTLSIISFTDKGDKLNERLCGYLSDSYSVQSSFQKDSKEGLNARTKAAFSGDAIIFIGAAGIAVRAIAPYIKSKDSDPAVIVIDELAQHVIPLLSGHIGGANRLSDEIASFLKAESVVTTATDINNVWSVDSYAAEKGCHIENLGMVKRFSSALLKGENVGVSISPYLRDMFLETLHIVPKCLCLGIGCKKDIPYEELRSFITGFLKDKNISFSAISDIATIDIKNNEEAISRFSREYNLPVSYYSAEDLNSLPDSYAFSGSDFVKKETGTDNVCERSAVKKALEYAPLEKVKLLEKKSKGNGITAALSIYGKQCKDKESSSKKGVIYVVGLGPGSMEKMTGEAISAIEKSDCVIGYKVYVELIRKLTQGKTVISSDMRKETERCKTAREYALQGNNVAMVCSGDSGIYGMAGLIYEVCRDDQEIEIEVIPGMTAAVSGSACLGSPLTNDFAVISLSDHLTPTDTINKRLKAAASADMAIVLYNPKSRLRQDNLRLACDIILSERSGDTVCGYVKNIGRSGESASLCTLKELPRQDIDMFTTVFIGNSDTVIINGKMVTKRGYNL